MQKLNANYFNFFLEIKYNKCYIESALNEWKICFLVNTLHIT